MSVFVVLAEQEVPVSVSWQAVASDQRVLIQQLDETRRKWKLSARVQRHDESDQEARTPRWREPIQESRRVVSEPDLDSVTRWPNRTLEAVAMRAAFSPVNLSVCISAATPEAAQTVAGVLLHSLFISGTGRVRSIETGDLPGASSTLVDSAATLMSTADAARVFSWPDSSPPCPTLLPDATQLMRPSSKESMWVGCLYDEFAERVTDIPVRQPWDETCKHGFVGGMSGSGKSTWLTHCQAEAARAEPPIPVLLISFAKDEGPGLSLWDDSEDPRLRDYARRIVFCGVDPNAPIPVRVSPFGLPGADPLERADHAYGVILKGIPAEGPLPGIIREGIDLLCQPLATPHTGSQPPASPEGRNPPPLLLTDLLPACRSVVQARGYSPGVESDVIGALASRLADLNSGLSGELFRAATSRPVIEDVLRDPHVISCGLCSIETTAMFVADLFQRLERHILRHPTPPPEADPVSHSGSQSADESDEASAERATKARRPRLIVILDEVQEVCPRASIGGRSRGDRPDIVAELARLLRRSVKVFRGFNLPVFLASQHPGAIDEELVKGVGTHIAFAQRHAPERDELRGVMGLSAAQYEALDGLPVGQAFFRGPNGSGATP